MEVSDPRSPNYGKYWSAEKVHDAFAPSTETVKEVMEWLSSCGIPSHRVAHSKNKGWLAFDAPAHEVEKLLNTDYHEHHHSNGEIRVGTDEYALDQTFEQIWQLIHLDITFHLTSRNTLTTSLRASNYLRHSRNVQRKGQSRSERAGQFPQFLLRFLTAQH
jgi:tripeptidyl-peptidase I